MRLDILQLTERTDYRFEWWSWAKDEFNINDYELVYVEEIENTDEPITDTLEKMFTKFNINRPEDFHGHSLSVSDVIRVVEENKEDKFWYCDAHGWVDITDYCVGAL